MNKQITPELTASKVNVEVIANHYQKTYEVAYENWKERNKIFIFLVLTAIVGLLLLQRGDLVNELFVKYVQKYFELKLPDDETLIDAISRTVPFSLMQSGILVAMFYFMQRLHATNLTVMRTYKYLSILENEIQPYLGLPGKSGSFTRESKFYWNNRVFMQTMSKWSYVVVLFVLLIPFMVFKLASDFGVAPITITAVDTIVSALTFAYWVDYARSAFKLDKDPAADQKKK